MQSFLSLALFPFNSYLLLAAVKEKLLGRMETCCGVLLSREWRKGSYWVMTPIWECIERLVCSGETRMCQYTSMQGSQVFPLPLRRAQELELLDDYLTVSSWEKAKSSPKEAGTSVQTEDIVALWNSLMKVMETVFSIFEIWCLWSSACDKIGWGKTQGENAQFLFN